MEIYKPELIDTIMRLRDDYRWNWGLIRNLVKRQFAANISAPELLRLYKSEKSKRHEKNRGRYSL